MLTFTKIKLLVLVPAVIIGLALVLVAIAYTRVEAASVTEHCDDNVCISVDSNNNITATVVRYRATILQVKALTDRSHRVTGKPCDDHFCSFSQQKTKLKKADAGICMPRR